MGGLADDGRELTVLYDEQCGFCTAAAEWLRYRSAHIGIAPIGSLLGERALRDLPPAHRYDSVHVVDRYGRRRSGAESLPTLFAAVPGLGWAAAASAALPGPARVGYVFVANHRRLISRLVGERLRRASHGRAG